MDLIIIFIAEPVDQGAEDTSADAKPHPAEESAAGDKRFARVGGFWMGEGIDPKEKAAQIIRQQKYQDEQLGDVKAEDDGHDVTAGAGILQIQIGQQYKTENGEDGESPIDGDDHRSGAWRRALRDSLYRLENIPIDEDSNNKDDREEPPAAHVGLVLRKIALIFPNLPEKCTFAFHI